MAITGGMCSVYKRDVHDGVHLPGHTYKMALYRSATASLSPATTGYTTTGEATGTGYTAGGITLTGRTVALQGTTGTLDFTDPVWTGATLSAEGALVYNDTVAGKPAIAVIDFGGTITSTAGPFTVDLPASGAGTSFLRFP